MNFTLWLAQGFGSGRIPLGPGTWGSLVGLLWFAVLLAFQSPIVFLIGVILSIPLSVWACGEAEKILRDKDPGSVVIDEIIAVPICFAAWLGYLFFQQGTWPAPDYFFSRENWPTTAAVFVLFRISDVAKPWPVRQSQELPGGWGVTIDDVLAAV
ncbi:MAG: phosphatidylglycerophosphatase A, partial [Limisphaerales bacterium]